MTLPLAALTVPSSDLESCGDRLDCDVLIVGGGMVGATLAAALGQTELTVKVIEARALDLQRSGSVELGADGRASALALGTVRMFQAMGIWSQMSQLGVSPIHRIQVSDGQFSQVATLHRDEIQAEALGYVVPNWVTQMGVLDSLDRCDNVQLLSSTRVQQVVHQQDAVAVAIAPAGEEVRWLRSRLLVAADGARSRLRQNANIPVSSWGYGQACIVATVTTARPHSQTAFERFQPSGPFAILPVREAAGKVKSCRSCVVWTIRETERDRLMALGDADFIAALSPSFGPQLGAIESVGPRACYTPQRSHSRTYVKPRFALVGDAAHSTHPVGGQGVNLGMRDVAALAQVLVEARAAGEDIGDLAVLQRYEHWRRFDNGAVLFATDAANRLFSNQLWPLQWLRRLGLLALPLLPPLKRWLMRQAMGLGGRRAHLIDGRPLGRSLEPVREGVVS
ncbi:UbiH/UbiF/VisC/COQ6 family ubiquinone biosynthesis hydroxylase [Synechococcus sp. PCC 7336]|uniref:UbiH/UbiF/VisC/COQ6 family ubiquinone biosynthesis hydroxylase n=1 Tax=Synechococcus sp. PCC 7336 TaxID=195250 RepID=UPI0003482733|nr:UbiH/UbiF/VisC/COQ6 family ubiquinone biosynthesis hydroxylase [Synechococcus sp. PCC 7336]